MEIQLNNKAVDLTGLAVGIIVLALVVTIGAVIVLGVRDARLTDLSTVQTANETTWINTTTDTLANVWGKSVDICYNATDNASIASGNYTATISAVDGKITLANASTTQWNSVKCTYTWYNTTRADWDTANDAVTGLSEYGNWFDILVIAGVAAVILAIIFMSFGRSAGEGGVSY